VTCKKIEVCNIGSFSKVFSLPVSITNEAGQGCQVFLGTKFQNGEKYARLTRTIPNVHKIDRKSDQVAIKYVYQHLPIQDPPKFTQIWIFGLKTNHLATLKLVAIT
jgi:hypothetical protein